MWHGHLGHPSSHVVQRVVSQFGLPVLNKNTSFCSSSQGKGNKLSFFDSMFVASSPLDLNFSDIWEPASIISSHGYCHYIHFAGSYSHFTWYFPVYQKSYALMIFQKFKLRVENLLGCKIKTSKQMVVEGFKSSNLS